MMTISVAVWGRELLDSPLRHLQDQAGTDVGMGVDDGADTRVRAHGEELLLERNENDGNGDLDGGIYTRIRALEYEPFPGIERT